MNTKEFSELLKTLLDEVHNRVVEQYSKAEAIGVGTTTDLPAGNWQQTLSTVDPPKCSTDSVPQPKQTAVCIDEIRAHDSQTSSASRGNANDNPTLKSELSMVPLPPLEENDIGRCFTVPDVPPCRPSLRSGKFFKSNGSFSIDSVFGRYSQWVINPESTIMHYWFIVNILSMAFVALVSPVQVALMETKLDTMFVVNCIVDSVFIVDMILQFFLMYHVKTLYGNRLEQRLGWIARHYLRTWFTFDLISVLPFDILSVVLEDKNDVTKAKGVKFVRFLRLLKMMRMLKLTRIFEHIEKSVLVTNTYQVFDLYKLILFLILTSHWLACLWAMTLSLVDSDQARWVDTFQESEVSVEVKTKDSVWKIYIAAMYFTVYTLTSVGYGDITPVNILERVVCILILFFSGLVWACMISQIAYIFGNLDKQDQEFRSLMDNLNCMMKDRELSLPVRRRLRTFFISARQAQRNERQEQLLRRLSPVLKGEVALMSNWAWVNKVSFIYSLVPEAREADATRAPHFVVDFALALKSSVFAQSEVFGLPRVLYILKKGLVLSRARNWMKVFCAGDVWGQDFVLSKNSLRESEVRLAVTYVEIFQLTFDEFKVLCQRHHSNLELRKRLRQFAARLSARRAILYEARLRRDAMTAEEMPSSEFLMP